MQSAGVARSIARAGSCHDAHRLSTSALRRAGSFEYAVANASSHGSRAATSWSRREGHGVDARLAVHRLEDASFRQRHAKCRVVGDAEHHHETDVIQTVVRNESFRRTVLKMPSEPTRVNPPASRRPPNDNARRDWETPRIPGTFPPPPSSPSSPSSPTSSRRPPRRTQLRRFELGPPPYLGGFRHCRLPRGVGSAASVAGCALRPNFSPRGDPPPSSPNASPSSSSRMAPSASNLAAASSSAFVAPPPRSRGGLRRRRLSCFAILRPYPCFPPSCARTRARRRRIPRSRAPPRTPRRQCHPPRR